METFAYTYKICSALRSRYAQERDRPNGKYFVQIFWFIFKQVLILSQFSSSCLPSTQPNMHNANFIHNFHQINDVAPYFFCFSVSFASFRIEL